MKKRKKEAKRYVRESLSPAEKEESTSLLSSRLQMKVVGPF